MKKEVNELVYWELNDCVQVKNILYFFTSDGVLTSLDVDTFDTEYVRDAGGFFVTDRVNGRILYADNKLFWNDSEGKWLSFMDLDTLEVKKTELPDVIYKDWCSIICAAVIDEKVFLVPKYSPKIICFNIKDESFTEKEYNYDNFFDDAGIFRAKCVGNRLFALSNETQKLIILDIDTWEAKYINYPRKMNIFNICDREGVVYLNSSAGIWRIMSGASDLEYWRTTYCENGFLVLENNYNYLFPQNGDRILTFKDTEGSATKYIEFPDDYIDSCKNWDRYMGSYVGEDYIWIASRGSNYMARINRKSASVEWIKPKEIEKVFRRELYFQTHEDVAMNEQDIVSFKDFISWLDER